MGYGSFYGGRKGASFIIVKNYKDIISMVLDFAKGNNFSQVKYDEYVLINTVNKNHPDNGKIFRRGYDYNSSRTIEGYRAYKKIDGVYQEIINGKINNEEVSYNNARYQFDNAISAGGAIYIGTIVGPSGNAPFLTLTPYDEVTDYFNNAPEDRREFKAGTISKDDLLPGKKISNDNTITYNDDILWYSASVISENSDNGHAYIGFKVPYLVVDFSTKELTPYENINIKRLDEPGEHPFYAQWQIAIPRGKQGNAIKNIKKINLINYFTGEDIDNLPKIYETPTSTEAMSTDRFRELGFIGNEDIIVYTYQNYNESNPPEEKICYLAQYKQIKDITITEDGDLGIVYSNNDQDLFQKVVSRITRLSYTENGFLRIEYNTGETLSIPIIYPNKIQLKDNGTLAFKTNIEDDTVLENPNTDHTLGVLKWIDNISYNNESKQIIITYNTDENELMSVPFISDIRIQDNGQVDIKKGGEDWEPVYVSDENLTTRILRWIRKTSYNSMNNELQIYYNSDSDNDPSVVIPNVFQKIESIIFRESLIVGNQDENPYIGPGFEIMYSDGAIQRIPFLTGNLIKSISLIPGSGYDDIQQGQISNAKLRIEYTNGSAPDELQLDGNLISDILLTEGQVEIEEENSTITLPTNSLRIRYDNGTFQDLDNFIYPRSVKVYDDSFNSSHSIVFYDSKGQEIERTEPLTNIERIKIYNNRLVVLYNNPTARDNIPTDQVISLEEPDGTVLNWDNLGVVRADTGILVGRNFTITEAKVEAGLEEEDELTNEDIISFLNNLYQNGTVLNNLYRIVTVGNLNQNKKFFGYDIRNLTWYYLGTIPGSASSQNDMTYGTKEEFESDIDIKKDSLRIGGIFFIIKGEDDQNNSSTEPESQNTFSGSVVHFLNDINDTPINNVKIAIEPVQSGSGDPSSGNIRSITGWTGAEVTRCGKNILERRNDFMIASSEGIDYSVKLDGSISISGTATGDSHLPYSYESYANAMNAIPFRGMTLTGHIICADSNVSATWQYCKEDRRTSFDLVSGTQKQATFTVPIDAVGFIINISIPSGAVIDDTTAYMQLELGTTATSYEPYNGITYSITFPSEAETVYGGTLDVTNGELVVDRARIESYNGETLPSTWISDRDVYSEGATPTIGARVVYKLDTSITYTLTPQEITSLLGENNLWADTGNSTVEV